MTFLHLDKTTISHSLHVAMLSKNFGEYCGFNNIDTDTLFMGGLLHDVGKFLIPIDILNSPNLTSEEFDLIKTHPELGYLFLKEKSNNYPCLSDEILYIVHEHHEQLNGAGYPLSLNESEIHVLSQIVTICDVFDALITERPYKPAFSINRSFEIMDENVKNGGLNANLYKKFTSFIFSQMHLREQYADDIIC